MVRPWDMEPEQFVVRRVSTGGSSLSGCQKFQVVITVIREHFVVHAFAV